MGHVLLSHFLGITVTVQQSKNNKNDGYFIIHFNFYETVKVKTVCICLDCFLFTKLHIFLSSPQKSSAGGDHSNLKNASIAGF